MASGAGFLSTEAKAASAAAGVGVLVEGAGSSGLKGAASGSRGGRWRLTAEQGAQHGGHGREAWVAQRVAVAVAVAVTVFDSFYICIVMERKQSFEEGTSSGVEKVVAEAAVEMESNVEVKSRKRRKRKKGEWGDASDRDIEWVKSLSDCQLDLMLSIKR